MDVPEIDARALRALLQADAPPVVVDVREPYEYAQGFIPGSLRIPMNDIPERLNELDRNAEIIMAFAATT